MSHIDRWILALCQFLERIGLGKLAAEILLLSFMGGNRE